MTGINNVISGVTNFLKSDNFKAALGPLEAELINEIFGLLEAHAAKTATPVDDVIYALGQKAINAKIQPVGHGNVGNP